MNLTLLKTLLLMIAGVEKQDSNTADTFPQNMILHQRKLTKNSLTVDGKNAGAWASLMDLIEMKIQKTTALLKS